MKYYLDIKEYEDWGVYVAQIRGESIITERMSQFTYVVQKWYEWINSLPLRDGYEHKNALGTTIHGRVYLRSERDCAIMKLAFDSSIFE